MTANFATEGVPIQLSEPTLVDPFADEEGGEGEEAAEGGEVEEDEGPPAAFWACAAITGVGLVAGTVFGTMALSDEEEFEDTGRTDTSIQETGERNALIADISFIVAAASAVVGIVVLATDKDDEEPVEEPVEEAKSSLEVYPVAGADTVGVGATVTF